jgi:16S rRNA G966 N2-methylase RsmD
MNPNVYTRPKKPKIIPVTKRKIQDIEEINLAPVVSVHASSECHVTKMPIAIKMANYLGYKERLLEPSAGIGNLVVVANAGHITAIEKHYVLYMALSDRIRGQFKNINVLLDDFLTYQPEQLFDGILMNPPFSKVKVHIAKAIDCLAPKGDIVAIVPITFEHDRAETIEELPRDIFMTCNVSTKIIKIS